MNFDLLYTMLNTESVSGGEIPLQKKVAAYMREAGFNVDTDKTGNVIAHINEESAVKVLMSGHIAQGWKRAHGCGAEGYVYRLRLYNG